jgi:hypothetical protein
MKFGIGFCKVVSWEHEINTLETNIYEDSPRLTRRGRFLL